MKREGFVLREDLGGGVFRLVLNHPETYNSLSFDMLESLQSELSWVNSQDRARVLIISGAGKGFCAGHNLRELRNESDASKIFFACREVMFSIVGLSIPVIAQVHGVATAAGCQLVATCDLAYATKSSRFATPGVNLGLFCSTPMVALSRNLSPKHAMEFLLTGDLISAPEAARMGLINRVVDEGDLASETEALAKKLSGKPCETLKKGKQAFYQQLQMPLEKAYDFTTDLMIQGLESSEAKEGIEAFLEKKNVRKGE